MGSQTGRKSEKKVPGYLYRKRGRYYWKVKKPGEDEWKCLALILKGERCATKNKGHAQACQRRLWRQWGGGQLSQPSTKLTAWIEQFRAVLLMEQTTTNARRIVYVLNRFAEHQKIEYPDEITPKAAQDYLLSLSIAPGTIHKHRNAIRKFCRFLRGRDQLETNPADRDLVTVPRLTTRPPRFLNDDQINGFLKKLGDAPEWLRQACLVGLYEGLRKAEIRQLRVEDIYRGSLMVGGLEPTKTGDYRTLPIFPEVAELLKGLRNGEPEAFLFRQKPLWWWGDQLRKITKDLPVFGELKGRRTGNQWHLLRSTFTVVRARQGATLWELMAWLGHKNPQTTMRYLNIAHAAGMVKEKQRPWDKE